MSLIKAVTDGQDDGHIYLTREVQNMQACSAKDRVGLGGVKWAGSKNYVWATDGSVLVLRPMDYWYKGKDWNLTFSGPMMGNKEFFSVNSHTVEEAINTKGDPYTEVFKLKSGKIVEVSFSEPDSWPDIETIVHGAVAEADKTGRPIGMDLALVQKITKGLGTQKVLLVAPRNALDPAVIRPLNNKESLLITGHGGEDVFTKFGIAMPMRID